MSESRRNRGATIAATTGIDEHGGGGVALLGGGHLGGAPLAPLGPPVLEPDLHLRLGHGQLIGQLGPLGARQVLGLLEGLLQYVDLVTREGRPSVLLIVGVGVVAVIVFAIRGQSVRLAIRLAAATTCCLSIACRRISQTATKQLVWRAHLMSSQVMMVVIVMMLVEVTQVMMEVMVVARLRAVQVMAGS